MPRLQIPSAISPQGRLSGNVQAPAAALANTGGVQAWGAATQAIAGAVAQIGEYRQRLQNAVDEGEAANLNGSYATLLNEGQKDIEQMPLDNPQALRERKQGVWEGFSEELNANQKLSKESRRRLLLKFKQQWDMDDIKLGNFIDKRLRVEATANMDVEQERLLRAGNIEGAAEIEERKFKLGMTTKAERESKLMDLTGRAETYLAESLFQISPFKAIETITARDEDGSWKHFKNIPEQRRAALTNLAKSVENNARNEYFDRLETMELAGDATAETYQQAFEAGYLNRDQYNRKMTQFEKAGDAAFGENAFNTTLLTDLYNEIGEISSLADLANVRKKLENSELHSSLRGFLHSTWQSVGATIRKDGKPGRTGSASTGTGGTVGKYIIGGPGGIVKAYTNLINKETNPIRRAQLSDEMVEVIDEINRMVEDKKSDDEIRAYRDEVLTRLGGTSIRTLPTGWTGAAGRTQSNITKLPGYRPYMRGESVEDYAEFLKSLRSANADK